MSKAAHKIDNLLHWFKPPPQDAEWLDAARRHLERKHKDSDLFPTPITSLRIFQPHSPRFMAADGTTSFRYLKVLKNATSSILRALAETRRAELSDEDFLSSRRPNNQVDAVTWRGRSEYVVANGHRPGLYWFLPSNLFHPEPYADVRFCVVRDPVERFVSAWLNRIYAADDRRGGKVGDNSHSAANGSDRSLEAFVREVEAGGEGRKAKGGLPTDGIAARDGHFHPHSYFLGTDPSYFTHIFNIRQLAGLEHLLSELSGQPIAFGRYNHSDRLARPQIDGALRRRIEALYADDYRIFGKHF